MMRLCPLFKMDATNITPEERNYIDVVYFEPGMQLVTQLRTDRKVRM